MTDMSELKKLIKGVKVNFSQDEYEFLTTLAKKRGHIPIARLVRSLILEYIESNDFGKSNQTSNSTPPLKDLIDRISSLESDNQDLLAWKKEVEASINTNPPSLDDENLDIDWEEINANNIRNQEIIQKLEKQLKSQQKEEIYVPGSLKGKKDAKDRI